MDKWDTNVKHAKHSKDCEFKTTTFVPENSLPIC